MKGFGKEEKKKKRKFNSTDIKLTKEEILKKALNFHKQNKINKAEKYYHLFLEKGFTDERVYSNYGVICEQKKDYGKAIELFKKAISNTKSNPAIYTNLGNVLRKENKLDQAERYYRKAIEVNPEYFEANSNLGSILIETKNFKDAKLYIKKAIDLNPNFAIGYTNLGIIEKENGNFTESSLLHKKAIKIDPNLSIGYSNIAILYRELGKYEEAYKNINKAIEINPQFAIACLNKGNIEMDFGQLDNAEKSIKEAIKLNPSIAEAYSSLGAIYRDKGNLKSALEEFNKAISFGSDLGTANIAIGKVYQDSGDHKEAFTSYYKEIIRTNGKEMKLLSIVGSLKELNLNGIDRNNVKNLLEVLFKKNDLKHSDLFGIFNYLYKPIIFSQSVKDKTFRERESSQDIILNEQLIINALKKIIFTDIDWERLLQNIRRKYCNLIANKSRELTVREKELILALSEQCFMNEYIYQKSEEENVLISKILDRNREKVINSTDIIILTCYDPLYKLVEKNKYFENISSYDKSLFEIELLQLKEIKNERKLAKEIKKIGNIIDETSIKIRNQYENNPYPRWRFGNKKNDFRLSPITIVNEEIKPNTQSFKLHNKALQILIAGCGTGNQIFESLRFNNCKIKAIDLSNSSLSYAKRKLIEQEIDNIELIQMDLLDISLLETKFDIIECGGVLHHMANPLKGLETLTSNLKKGGFMKLGLYSELARKDIVKIRKIIKEENISYSKDSVIDFRERMISKKIINKNNLFNSPDLYSFSSFIDLCFNQQEYRFTINELKKALSSNQLEFLGFYHTNEVKSLYKNHFPEDKRQINLDNWEEFENIYPNTFSKMYQFWVKK